MPKRIGNEAKTINLFLSLSDEGRRIVLDVIKSQSATPRKAATKKPSASPSAQKEPATGMVRAIRGSLERGKKEVSDVRCVAQVPTIDVPCGEREDALIHDQKAATLLTTNLNPQILLR